MGESFDRTLLRRSRSETWYFVEQMECMGGVLGMYSVGFRGSSIYIISGNEGGTRELLRVSQKGLAHQGLPSAIVSRGEIFA